MITWVHLLLALWGQEAMGHFPQFIFFLQKREIRTMILFNFQLGLNGEEGVGGVRRGGGEALGGRERSEEGELAGVCREEIID
jgi:hypothetical protein